MNPYKIGPYKECDSQIFCGRTKEIDSMYRSFLEYDYIVCYANSGEGKSSILNAGLFPKLRTNKYFPINIRFRFDDNEDLNKLNFDNIIINAINDEILEHSRDYRLEVSPLIETEDEDFNSWQTKIINSHVWLKLRYSTLKRISDNGIDDTYMPVLVFDQFEEVFTNPKTDIWTKKFFKWLEELSADVCPDSIIKTLESHINYEDFPIIKLSKKFKAIFSLRSEYVGNLDYWGLQHCYIPLLKNNRYFLKSLTYEGAREVVLQPEGLCISEAECDELISACSDNKDYVKENMPCVPASILSIVCHDLFEQTQQQRKLVFDSICRDRDVAVEKILENYYIRLLKECGICDDRIRDAFENALVDDKGNRKRIDTDHEVFNLISEKQIEKLKSTNLLRVVSKGNNKKDDKKYEVVELPHDRFCSIINNHKGERFSQIERKNETLKEWILFIVFLALFGISSLYIHFVGLDLLKPLIDNSLLSNEVPFLQEFLKFIKSQDIVSGYKEAFTTLGAIMSMVLFLPLLVICITRNWRKLAISIGVLSASLSLYLLNRIDGFSHGGTDTLILSTFLVSICIVFYCIIQIKRKRKLLISAWPLYASLYLFLFYLFLETVFSNAIGVNEPLDSFYFIILLPLLFLFFSLSYSKVHVCILKDKFFILKILILISLLILVSINNSYSYSCEKKFSSIWVIFLLVSIIILTINIYLSSLDNKKEKYFFISLNVLLLITVYILNLGYNPLVVRYRDVAKVYNWRTVNVKNDTSGLKGVRNPVNGKTIIPELLSNIDGVNAYISSSEFKVNPIKSGHTSNTDSTFIWNKDSSRADIITFPTLEQYIEKMSNISIESLNTLDEKIDFYSAQLFSEIRLAGINYIVKAQPYSLNDIPSFQVLDSLQNIKVNNQLSHLSLDTYDTTVIGIGKSIKRKKVEVLEDNDLIDFFSAVTRRFYLFLLKDRIYKKDFVSVFSLCNMFPTIYFTSVPLLAFKHNLGSSIIIDNVIVQNENEVIIHSQDIIEGKCFAWYNIFVHLCLFDNSNNMERYENKLRVYKNLSDKLMQLPKAFNDDIEEYMSYISSIIEMDNLSDLESFDDYLLKKKKRRKVTPVIDDVEYGIDSLRNSIKLLDSSFNDYCEQLYNTLLPMMEKFPNGIYNSAFEKISSCLMVTQLLRGYDIENRLDNLKSIDSSKNAYRNLLRNNNKEFNKQTKELEEEIEGILNKYKTADNYE